MLCMSQRKPKWNIDTPLKNWVLLHISSTNCINKCPELIAVAEAFTAKTMAASETWLSENDGLGQEMWHQNLVYLEDRWWKVAVRWLARLTGPILLDKEHETRLPILNIEQCPYSFVHAWAWAQIRKEINCCSVDPTKWKISPLLGVGNFELPGVDWDFYTSFKQVEGKRSWTNRSFLIQHKSNNARYRTDHNSPLLNIVITKAWDNVHGISSVISLSAVHMTV